MFRLPFKVCGGSASNKYDEVYGVLIIQKNQTGNFQTLVILRKTIIVKIFF